MIGPNNPEGNAVVQAVIDGLVDQTKTFERIVATLKLKAIKFEGSDSLDKPDAVLKEPKK
jgi:putative iron-regulated protein